MALTIVISGGRLSSYSPGEVVCGVVKLTSVSTDEPCESLSISFTGRTRVQLTRNNTDMVSPASVHKSSAGCLFRQCIMLDQATSFQCPGTLYWPFAFRLPSRATFKSTDACVDGGWFDCESPWKGTADAESHALPPSLHHSSTFQCSVEYVLNARLIRPPHANLQRRQNLTATAEITVMPHSVHCELDPGLAQGLTRSYYCNFSICHKNKMGAIKSRARRLNEITRRNSGPQRCCEDGALQLKIKIPKRIHTCCSSPIPLSAYMACSGCQHVGQIETVEVKRFTLDLIATTKVRVGCHQDYRRTILNLCSGAFSIPLVYSCQQIPETVENNIGNADLDNMGREARELLQKYSLVPEFATYNIFRAYSLRFTIKLSFAGERLSFSQDNIPVEVVHWAQQESEEVDNSSTQMPSSISQVTTIDMMSAGLDDQISLLTDQACCEAPPPAYVP